MNNSKEYSALFSHYLKVAFRNLWKYKNQTLISVFGLSVGFTCFAPATLWIRYETTYDNFLKNADRVYYINTPSIYSPTGTTTSTINTLATYLKSTFPEIIHAITLAHGNMLTTEIDGIEYPADFLSTDSSFISMFDVKIIEGSKDFLIYNHY
jgi:hypothetical protein